MYTPEILKTKLKDLGFRDEEINIILEDISKVILTKITNACLGELSEEEKKLFETVKDESNLKNMIENHFSKEKIKSFTKEDLENIIINTWDEYFDFVASK